MRGENSLCVLVVDDDPAVRKSLSNYLEDWDFEVFSAESGEDAVDIVGSQPPDVAIVDLRLPGISGEETVGKIHEICPGTRFMIYTGSVDVTPTEAMQNAGMAKEDIYLKPVADLKLFVDRINSLGKMKNG